MSKISKKIMIVLALSLVFVMVFAGCTSMTQTAVAGGDAKAVVENNGGLAVKQGAFIYYINGLTATADIKKKEDNTFGNVVKGAIMRAELDGDGNVKKGSQKVLVPLMALSANKKGGITVLGNWVYYTTPSIQKDKYDVLQTSYLEFMRTSIDGTVTQNIATVDGQSTEYKFTSDALVYFANGTITRVSYDDEKVGATDIIAENVSSVVLPMSQTFDPAKGATDDVIFYTKASQNDKDMFNITYAVGTKAGSEAKAIIDGKSYGEDKKTQYTISLKFANVVADGIELYYEKANTNDHENKAGIFGAKYANGVLDVKNEVRFTGESQTTIFPMSLESGLYVLQNGKLTLRKESVSESGVESFFAEDSAIELPSGAVIVDFVTYKYFDGSELESVLYIDANKLYVRPLANNGMAAVAITTENDYAIDSSWLMPEVISGKVYFFNTNYYKYMEMVDLATGDFVEGENGKLAHPLAQLNEADAKAEKEKAEAEEKENNK